MRSARTAVPITQRRALAPPQRGTGRQIGLEGGGAGVERTTPNSPAQRVPQCLLLRIDACASLDFRLDAAFDHIQENRSTTANCLGRTALVIGTVDPRGGRGCALESMRRSLS